MPSAPENIPIAHQPARPKQPIFERVQDWIFKLDIGYGVQWFRLGLFLLLVLAVILIYTGTQFYGLRDPEAMDAGQLARNLAAGRGYVTRNIRPVDLSYLIAAGKPVFGRTESGEQQNVIPELWTPPVYPTLLSVFFKVMRPRVNLADVEQQLHLKAHELPEIKDWPRTQALYEAARIGTLKMDRVIVIAGWVFFLFSLGMVYLLARELFDHRVAMMSVVLYLLCDPMLDACVSGAPMAWMASLFMVSAYALVKAEQWAETKTSIYWPTGALAVCGLAVGLGTLTRYAFGCVVLPLVVYVSVSIPQLKRYVKLGIVLGAFTLVVLPWVLRNLSVSGTTFGLARLALRTEPALDLPEATLQLQLQRRLEVPGAMRWRRLAAHTLVNLDKLYRESLKDTGANYLMAFFLASLLHRFKRDDVFRLRRYLFWSLLMALVFLALAGPPKRNFFTMFIPLIMIYASAFFFVMFERLQFRTRWIRRGMVGLFAVLNVLPFVLTLLPPAAFSPYPPYDGGVVATIGGTFGNEEMLASDIPWAVAWYSDRSAVLMPAKEEEYIKINDEMHVFAGIYMTQLTLNEIKSVEVLSGLHQFWLSKYTKPAANFPLQHSRPVTPDLQQILTSNKAR